MILSGDDITTQHDYNEHYYNNDNYEHDYLTLGKKLTIISRNTRNILVHETKRTERRTK